MPDSAAEAIQVAGSGQYVVPSATHPGISYEVLRILEYARVPLGSKVPYASTTLYYRRNMEDSFLVLLHRVLTTGTNWDSWPWARSVPRRQFFGPFRQEEPNGCARAIGGVRIVVGGNAESPEFETGPTGTQGSFVSPISSFVGVPKNNRGAASQPHPLGPGGGCDGHVERTI
ncbi:hypothetical protein MTO96_026056 [Rhipicephalus appendiculatus]